MTTKAQAVAKSPTDRGPTQDQEDTTAHVSPRSKELVIGIVGYAGAGCSTVAKKLRDFLHAAGYEVHYIKLSKLIEARADPGQVPAVEDGVDEGKQKLERACRLQDIGDALREKHGNYAIASLSTKSIIETRGQVEHGESKLAFILDCIKHNEEVTLLRRVYDQSFRLIAVHCQRTERESRLIGDYRSVAKYKGANKEKVVEYMNRDEKDKKRSFGQHVRDAFYLADYFLDNNRKTTDAVRLNSDIERFIDLLLGRNLIRPDLHEVGMYHAHTAALKSACLSRQVGAALEVHGKIVATGTNEVPKFGGGVYGSGERPDNRCFAWDWKSDGVTFRGCHNTRRKRLLRENIVAWLADNFSAQLAEAAHPVPASGQDVAAGARSVAETTIRALLMESGAIMDGMPGIKDLIEFSRSVHAEMNALLNCARSGVSPEKGVLYCTTFPCHYCARHLIAAGLSEVYFVEPYVKSLATELHCDAIATEVPLVEEGRDNSKKPDRMLVVPFTGVGPRMYEDFFLKHGDLKNDETGEYVAPRGEIPAYAVRLNELAKVEQAAAELVPDS